MRRKIVVGAACALSLVLAPAVASAHSVGTPGTPSCFGERISHGSSSHGRTPKERAAGLQEQVDAGFAPAIELFGDTVSVQEMIRFVRANCSDNPIVPS